MLVQWIFADHKMRIFQDIRHLLEMSLFLLFGEGNQSYAVRNVAGAQVHDSRIVDEDNYACEIHAGDSFWSS